MRSQRNQTRIEQNNSPKITSTKTVISNQGYTLIASGMRLATPDMEEVDLEQKSKWKHKKLLKCVQTQYLIIF